MNRFGVRPDRTLVYKWTVYDMEFGKDVFNTDLFWRAKRQARKLNRHAESILTPGEIKEYEAWMKRREAALKELE